MSVANLILMRKYGKIEIASVILSHEVRYVLTSLDEMIRSIHSNKKYVWKKKFKRDHKLEFHVEESYDEEMN